MIIHALCVSWKRELLEGVHQASDVYKIALYTAAANLNATTGSYTTDHEVSGSGYIAGGQRLNGFSVGGAAGTAWLDWTNDPYWEDATITARGALIYNSSKGKRAVAVIDFGSDQSSSNGSFIVEFPNADAHQALIKIN